MNNQRNIEKVTISLKTLNNHSDILSTLINNFSCPQNLDVENFLKKNAIHFDNSYISRTYLIFNKNNLSQGILAYVSMPKRVTLLKIAKALNLSAVEVATEWSK